jgi:uncharacterized Zn finger protein
MSFYGWRPYVPVAERRRKAQRELAKLKKKSQSSAPVTIEGRTIATSFWGKSWCANLERYSDYANRLPRGRTYVRNGSVVDLQIAKGEVTALVAGSSLYRIKITIAPVKPPRWKSMCRDCAGSVDSLVELLQGRFEKGVMDRVCRAGDGLFPVPGEIKLSCSCPDWADMCKHVAAVLYGVGARLDHKPQLLFVLRGVDENELIAGAESGLALPKGALGRAKILDEGDVAAVFGLEMDDSPAAGTSEADAPIAARQPLRPKTRKEAKSPRKASSNATGPKTADPNSADLKSAGTPSSGVRSAGAKSADAKSSRLKSSKVRVTAASPGDRRQSSTICPSSRAGAICRQ